jgi:hypothetical protein
MKLFDLPMFSFTDEPRHPVDFLAPNHLASTHPMSIFTQFTVVQRWDGDTQIGLNGLGSRSAAPSTAMSTHSSMSAPTSISSGIRSGSSCRRTTSRRCNGS